MNSDNGCHGDGVQFWPILRNIFFTMLTGLGSLLFAQSGQKLPAPTQERGFSAHDELVAVAHQHIGSRRALIRKLNLAFPHRNDRVLTGYPRLIDHEITLRQAPDGHALSFPARNGLWPSSRS